MWHYRDYYVVLILSKVPQFNVLVRVHFLVCGRFSVHFRVCVNSNAALEIVMSDKAIILSLPEAPTRCRKNLKGPSHEREDGQNQLKILEPLPIRGLSIDTSFSQIHSRCTVPLTLIFDEKFIQ